MIYTPQPHTATRSSLIFTFLFSDLSHSLSQRWSTKEFVFLLSGLESTVTHFRGGIDESQVDLLKGSPVLSGKERFSQDEDSLLAADATTFDHHELLIDLTVMRETAHWGDVFIGKVIFRATVALATSRSGLADSVDLLVDFGPVMVTELTRTGD